MRYRPGYDVRLLKRLISVGVQQDLLRAAISLIVLFGMYLGGAPLWVVLIAPLAAYAGLWLLVPRDVQQANLNGHKPVRRLEPAEATDAIRSARIGIDDAARSMTDPENAAQAEAIASWIDRSVDVIEEDGATDALSPLLELARFTNDLLSGYVKLCRRGLANSTTHAQMRQNLAELEARFRWFWEQLNRDAIVDLEALSAAIELFMHSVPSALDRNDVPVPNGDAHPAPLHAGEASPDHAYPVPIAANGRDPVHEQLLIASLTPRETETLRLLAGGRTNQQIADTLFISKHTVAKHVENICGKLEVQNRTEAAALAVRHGLI